MSVDVYKAEYGPVVTDEYRESVSKKSADKWKTDEYRTKTNKCRNEAWTDELRDRQSKIIKSVYDNGFTCWNRGKTKHSDRRLKAIGDKNRKNLLGRTAETHPYIQKHAEWMRNSPIFRNQWKPGGHMYTWSLDKTRVDLWRRRISETISRKCLSGEIGCGKSTQFHTGYYNGIFYASGLELAAMQLFDSVKYIDKWEKNFDVVPYIDKNGNHRRYLPDFKITLNTGQFVIIETKGYPDEDLAEKEAAAKKRYRNYHICHSATELQNNLQKYENVQDKVDNVDNT